jgi:hypothetical protein
MSIFDMPLARALRYAGAFVAIWTVAAAAAEGTFRWLGDRPSADLAGLYAAFGNGNYRLRPSVDTSATWSTGRFTVHTDELGLRCDLNRKMATRPGDQVDVLFLGDSQGFGNGVNYEDTIAGTFARLAAEDKYVVRNACVGGQAPMNQLALAQRLTQDNNVHVATYIYLFTPAGVGNCNGFTRVAVGADGRLYDGIASSTALMRIWVRTHLAIYSRFRDAVRASGIGVTADAETPFVVQVYDTAAEDTNAGACVEFLSNFKRFAAQHGATVQAVYVPLTIEMGFDPVRRVGERRGVVVDSGVPFRTLSSAAKKVDIPLYDLRPVLRDFHSRGEALSLLPDFHYTAPVSRAAGTKVWEEFRKRVHAGRIES